MADEKIIPCGKPAARGRSRGSAWKTLAIALWLLAGASALAEVGIGRSELFTVDTRYGFSEGAGLSDTFAVCTLFSGSAGDALSALFTVDTLSAGEIGQGGVVALYPTVSYTPQSGTVAMTVRAIDPLYGSLSSGTILWTLSASDGGIVSAGSATSHPGTGLWSASAVFGAGLSPGTYSVQYAFTSELGRRGSAALPFIVGLTSATVNGSIVDLGSRKALAGAQVALFRAGGANGLWTVVDAQYSGVVPPLATLLTRLTPVRPVATTGSDGIFAYADVPVGDSYVLVAAKDGCQQKHSGSFNVPAGVGTVSQSLYLDLAGTTLAAFRGDVGEVRDACQAILNGNAHLAGQTAERWFADDIYSSEANYLSWAGTVVGAVASGIASLPDGAAEVSAETMQQVSVKVTTELLLKTEFQLIDLMRGWLTHNHFPPDEVAMQASQVHTLYLDALDQKNEAFRAWAADMPVSPDLATWRVSELSSDLVHQSQQVANGAGRYVASPSFEGDIYGFALDDITARYRSRSGQLKAASVTEDVLSGVQIAGGGVFIVGAAAGWTGAGAAIAAAGGIASKAAGWLKKATFVAKMWIKGDMAMIFTTAICGTYPHDNGLAVQVLGDYVEFLNREADAPFYLHKDNDFRASTTVDMNLILGGIWGWGLTADGTADVTVKDGSTVRSGANAVLARCLSYGTWTPTKLKAWQGFSQETIHESSEMAGPVQLAVGDTTLFSIPYRGYSQNLLSLFKPHYLHIETYIGPWRVNTRSEPFYVWTPGVINPRTAASGASSLTTGDIVGSVASAVGRVPLSDLVRLLKDSEPVAQDSLTAATPTLSAQFTAATNLWAIDLRLFAPSDAGVSLMVTDSQGRRLGYSSTNGLTCRELTGFVTDMSERPVSLRLLQPPPGETYTVAVALLTPGPQPVQVSLFKEEEAVSGSLLAAQPTRLVVDLATDMEPRVDVRALELSQQEPLTSVTATLTNLAHGNGLATLALLTNTTQVLGDIAAGESAGVAWPFAVPAGAEPGKYTSAVRLTSAQTADLVVPVIAVIRRATNVVSLLEGTNTVSGLFQQSFALNSNGVADTWVVVPKGFAVVHADLGMAPASTNAQSPAIDVGADGQLDWAFSGLFDVGVHVDGLEAAFNRCLSDQSAGTDDMLIPIRLQANPGEVLQLGGLQLYLETAAPELRQPQVLPDGRVQMELLGQPGFLYSVEATSDLEKWRAVGSVSASDRVMNFTDDSALGTERRFYRAVLGNGN